MNKTYILQKPFASDSAGTFYIYDGGVCSGNFYYSNSGSGTRLTKEFVENTPELFLPKQEDKPKEWEILELFSKSNKDVCTKDQLVIYNYLKNDSRYLIEWGIKVVKRGVDGEVFTIGDEVTFKPVEKFSWVIDNFFISNDGSMLVRSKDNMNVEILDDDLIKKHIPIPEKYLRKQPPVDKDAFWTDEDMKEFARKITSFEAPEHWEKELQQFKQSKSTPKEDKIEIKVIDFMYGGQNALGMDGYTILANDKIPPEKYESVKKAIEKGLNAPIEFEKQPLLSLEDCMNIVRTMADTTSGFDSKNYLTRSFLQLAKNKIDG